MHLTVWCHLAACTTLVLQLSILGTHLVNMAELIGPLQDQLSALLQAALCASVCALALPLTGSLPWICATVLKQSTHIKTVSDTNAN